MNDSARDVVFVEGIEAECIIGTHPHERTVPQTVVIDLEMRTDARRAATGDDLAEAVDYEAAVQLVLETARPSRFRLVETLAERIAGVLLERLKIQELAITIRKGRAVEAAENVGLRIVRNKSDYGGTQSGF